MAFYNSQSDIIPGGGNALSGISKRNDDGSVIWTKEYPNDVFAEPPLQILFASGNLFAVNSSGVARIDPEDGSVIWNDATFSNAKAIAVDLESGKLWVGWSSRRYSSMNLVDGTGRVDYTHTSSGLPLGQPVNGIAISESGRVFITTSADNAILEIDPNTGAELNRTFNVGDSSGDGIITGVRIYEGQIYAGNRVNNDETILGGVRKWDLDLTSGVYVTSEGDAWAFDIQLGWLYWMDDTNALIRKMSLDTGQDAWTVSYDTTKDLATGHTNAIAVGGSTLVHVDGRTTLKTRSVFDGLESFSVTAPEGDDILAVTFEPPGFGPLTPLEQFTAGYARASAAPPKVTALIRPQDVQRSIDTDVDNLVFGPLYYTINMNLDVGELSNLRHDKIWFIRADFPGLRAGKFLRLKAYTINHGDPSIPVTCVFWDKND